MSEVFVLGGVQTDFARNVAREGKDIFALMQEALLGACERVGVAASEIETAHVGNFTGELFARQGMLGGLVASMHPDLAGVPTARHEAACASGSVALLAASAELEAGRYDLACVLGVELMRNVPGQEAAANLGVAAFTGREAEGAAFVWPHLFDRLVEVYEERHGLRYEHLMAWSRQAMDNARGNPNAQARGWRFPEGSFALDDTLNPVVTGRIRKLDCGQITDGAACVLLAGERFARAWAARRGSSLDAVPRLLGWGHRTGPMSLEEKLAGGEPYVFAHARAAVEDAWRRAGIPGVGAVDAVELHDCFTITGYVLLEHLGLAAPGRGFEAIESGLTARGGATPVNPGGGLIGLGHPVGATGVRMVLDAHAQVTGAAGDAQVDGARRVQTLNIGGSATTTVSFVVGT